MNTITQKVSISMLLAAAGSIFTLGCECTPDRQSSSNNSGYYASGSESSSARDRNNASDTARTRNNTPADNNITGTVDQSKTYTAASSPEIDRNTRSDNTSSRREILDNSSRNNQNDRYARGDGPEYVHTPQEGTHLETASAQRGDNRSSYDRDDMASRNRRDGSDTMSSRNSTGYSSTRSTDSTGAFVTPPADPNESREARETREARDARVARDTQNRSETQQAREAREARELRDSQNRQTQTSNDTAHNRNSNSHSSEYTSDSRRDTRRADGTYYTGNTNDRYTSDQVEYKTDIYGRKFADHPDNFEYIYDEQLGVYLIANTPSEYNGQTDTRRTSRDRNSNWNNDQYRETDRDMARDNNRNMNRDANRNSSRDTTGDMNRDIANDTTRDNNRNNDNRANNTIDSAPVFVPVTRADTADSTTSATNPPRTDSTTATTTPRTAATTTATTTPTTDSLRKDSKETVQTLTSNWSGEQKEAITALVAKYGQPDEMTASALMWKDKGGFVCTKVLKDFIAHKFPVDHKDFLEQTISYKVPAEMADELLAFDGSLIIDRTRGTLTARCDKEEHNILALNLANDIIKGSKTVEQARAALSEMAMAAKSGQANPYLQKLQFDARSSNAADPDSSATTPRASIEGTK